MAADDLAALERRFFSLVTRPRALREAPERPDAGADAGGVAPEAWLVGSPALDAAGRLGIYAEMYAARLLGVLAEDYRLARRWLGPEAFDELGAEYLAERPSRHPSLRHFGRTLPDFVRGRPGARPGLADLLALEWARGESFDAADDEPLAWGSLAALEAEAWPSLRLGFAPSVRLVRLETSADELWAALDVGAPPPEPRPEPRRVLAWRRGFVVYHRALPDDEASALEAVAAGASFGEVCERFARPAEPAEEAARRAFGALARWAVDGLLARA
ncbi:MAG TPA: DNA-binding domain-containing protein [Polyangiaceae bacterium]|nr:DNA-binding domain-containing protein [Polyangiaceae bacterium]